MPIYNNALTQRPANRLAYQGSIGPVPRNEYLGALADFLAQSYSPERTQQMQGVAQFLGVPAVSQTLDRLSYDEPLTTGAGGLGGTTRIRPEVLEAGMAVAPLAQPVTMATLQAARAARQAALAGGRVVGQELGATLLGQRPKTMLGAITPQPMYAVEPGVNQLSAFTKPKAEVSPLGFYSAVEQQALNIPRKQGTGESFLNDLAKGQDVKKYEIEAMGLDEFLKGKPNVTRQEVQDFIASNRVNVQERQLGGVITEDPVGIAKRKEIFDKYEPEIQGLYKEMDNPRYRLVNRGMSAEEYNRGVVLQNRGFRGEPLTAQEQSELDGILKRLDGNTVKEFANAEEARTVYLGMNPEERLQHSIRPVKSSTELQQEINKIQNIRDAEANAAYVVPEAAPTRYGKYQLPGGENYREILLKLPNTTSEAEKTYIRLGDLTRPMTEAELSEYRNARDIFLKETTQDSRTYKSSHWTEDPNVLAHIRVNDRVDADGKKMLLIEELQSDWHQAGREQGYKDPKLQAQAQEKITALKEEHKRLGKVKDATTNQEERNVIAQQRFDLMNQIFETSKLGSTGVPDAPFKDTWYQLALKRVIKEAVDKGYDRIGLTTGKRQIERFSDQLRQNVDEINFNPIGTQDQIIVNAKKNGQNTFSGTIKDGKFIDGQAQGKTVEEVLGKTMAKQIAEKKDGVIKGDDLTIGGEGMKKYYDEVYPAFLEKQGKKYGAKIGETRLTGTGSKDELAQKIYGRGETYKNLPSEQKRRIDQMFLEKGEPIRYLDITPEMREAVKKGQPLASITNHLANAMA
jgi:hypothetical protein